MLNCAALVFGTKLQPPSIAAQLPLLTDESGNSNFCTAESHSALSVINSASLPHVVPNSPM